MSPRCSKNPTSVRRFGAWAAPVLLALALPAGAAAAPSPEPPTISELGSDSVDRRRAAAEALASSGFVGPDAVEDLARRLAALRKGDDQALFALMQGVHRFGRDADLVELLVEQRPDPAVQRALATVCSMRALARLGTMPAVRQLVRVASSVGGVFRGELLRELRQLDDRATAALIEARGDPDPDARAWAKDVLDVLGKRTPGDTVQTTNDQVLVDVLRAYSEIADLDALAVVLSFVHSDRPQVRVAAREATLAYGKEALPKVRSTYLALTGERLPDGADAASAARALFAAYDRYRLRDVYAKLEEGLARERDGDLAGAIGYFDEVLARQPMLDRRAETVPAYVARAEQLEITDRPRALEYLRKASRVEEPGPPADRIESEILYVEGEELLSRGIDDTTPFEKALALDAQNGRAARELDRIRAQRRSRSGREVRIAAATGLAGLALVSIGLLGWRRSSTRSLSR